MYVGELESNGDFDIVLTMDIFIAMRSVQQLPLRAVRIRNFLNISNDLGLIRTILRLNARDMIQERSPVCSDGTSLGRHAAREQYEPKSGQRRGVWQAVRRVPISL